MWHTSSGKRSLEGPEARVFAETLLKLLSELKAVEGEYITGIDVFDRLTYGQKISVLSIVGKGLLKPDQPIRKLTAVVEGGIASVFEYLKTLVCIEIDEGITGTYWRELILAARNQLGAAELTDINSDDYRDWIIEIEELSDSILWDADYLDENLYVDDSPEHSQALKDFMRIRDDYFLEIPEDLRPQQLDNTVAKMEAVCSSVKFQ
jgi:hypothetical protein